MWYRQYSEELDLLGNDYGAKIMLHRLLDERDVTDYPVSGLFSLLKKAKKKDSETYLHNQRVSAYALKIANKLELSKDMNENIAFAALFHDIGKLNIHECILKKVTPISKEEYELIKQHSIYGVQLVQNTYCENVSDIIIQHHERLDGSGYPKGLKGDQILLEARIIAVSDAYDAMISERAYKKAKSPQEAIDELISCSGRHFDPLVVEALIAILKEEGVI